VPVSRGRMMRYGCYKARAPALLAGGVVAGSQGCPLVASARLPDAPPALDLAAVDRTVTLPTVAAGADGHQSAAPPAVEHSVALFDGSGSGHRALDAAATVGDIPFHCCVIALAVTQKPRPLRQQPGLRLLGGSLVLPHGLAAGHVSLGRAGAGWSGGAIAAGPPPGATTSGMSTTSRAGV
jgi:hypothetical protein